MNAIVDIYFDNNLGDNIMGEMILNFLQEKNIRCYIIVNDKFTCSCFLEKYPNVQTVPDFSIATIKKYDINYYIRVGGSMFQHNTPREGIFRYIRFLKYLNLKLNKVKLLILNCNVGPFNSSVGINATKLIIKISDLITCRDIKSYNFIRKYNKNNSYLYPDIVFSFMDSEKINSKENILGISTYTGYIPKLKRHNEGYSKLLIEIINLYLEKSPKSIIKFFVFDSGYNSDYPTTNKIYSEIHKKVNVQIISFNGDIKQMMDEFSKCKTIIGTRFHAIVLSVLYKIPVLPIPYSNKTINLLEDLNYDGPRINFSSSTEIDCETLVNSLLENKNLLYKSTNELSEKAKGHISILKKYMNL